MNTKVTHDEAANCKAKEFHIALQDEEMAKQKVANILSEASQLSVQTIKQIMQQGAVWLEDNKGVRRIRRANTKIAIGNILHFYYSPDILKQIPKIPTLIADQQHYSVWNKPPGMLCQGSKWSDHCTITRWIETRSPANSPFTTNPQRPCFLVHRLDKATHGLMIIAHTKKATQQLTALFEARKIQKFYHAIVEGQFPDKAIHFTTAINNKTAHSIARQLDYQENTDQSLVEVEIKTGRKHQVRIHLSQAGYPIAGDRLHGNVDGQANNNKANNSTVDLQLCAYRLRFTCPITEQQTTYTLPASLHV